MYDNTLMVLSKDKTLLSEIYTTDSKSQLTDRDEPIYSV